MQTTHMAFIRGHSRGWLIYPAYSQKVCSILFILILNDLNVALITLQMLNNSGDARTARWVKCDCMITGPCFFSPCIYLHQVVFIASNLPLFQRSIRPQVVTTFELPGCFDMWTVIGKQVEETEVIRNSGQVSRQSLFHALCCQGTVNSR